MLSFIIRSCLVIAACGISYHAGYLRSTNDHAVNPAPNPDSPTAEEDTVADTSVAADAGQFAKEVVDNAIAGMSDSGDYSTEDPKPEDPKE